MNEVYINGSGYVDPTAGRAIGGMQMFNPGDIVSRITKTGYANTCVIIAANERTYQFLMLMDEETFSRAYEVDCGSEGKKYTDPFRICWTYEENMEHLVTLTDQEFEALREAVAAASGYYYSKPEETKPAEIKPEPVVQLLPAPDPREEYIATLLDVNEQLKLENARLLGRIDVYKEFGGCTP